jgi:hypothetical protein
MSPKINYRRKNWIPKMPVKKVNKVQIPDNVYDRTKEKEKTRRLLTGEIDENSQA